MLTTYYKPKTRLSALTRHLPQLLRSLSPNHLYTVVQYFPDPERFNESNPKLYDPFQRDLRAKFRADEWQYPSAQDKTNYIMSRLSGVAKLRAEAWMTVIKKTNQIITDHENLLKSLSHAYHDPESEKRALDKLANYRQTN